MDLHALLVECAAKEGFPLAAGLDLDLAFSDRNSIEPHIEYFDQWIQAGFGASMEYLTRGRDRRANPKLLFPLAESIFCIAIPYPKRAAGSTDTQDGPRYARYLQGTDYHLEIAEKLERVMQAVKLAWNFNEDTATSVSSHEFSWKICVDTSAVLERSWAALAGLGWIGKNTLLIHPQYGSYIFLAEVLINKKLERGPSPLPNYCGNCTRCLDACPTNAFTQMADGKRRLDSNRCISYWTLEKRGELPISIADKKKIGAWVAGCDICQEACPFNRKPTQAALQQGEEISNENATELRKWQELLLEDSISYPARVKNSALKRVKPAQFKRNLAIALSNSFHSVKETKAPLELIAWAKTLEPLVRDQHAKELDPVTQAEWQVCLELFSDALNVGRF